MDDRYARQILFSQIGEEGQKKIENKHVLIIGAEALVTVVGVISSTVEMVVANQTTEVLKLLIEDYQSLRNKLVSFDLWKNEHVLISVDVLKKSSCLSCVIIQHTQTYPMNNKQNQPYFVAETRCKFDLQNESTGT